SGPRAGDDGAKRRRESQGHRAVDTLGHLLVAHVTAASEQDRSQVTTLAAQVQEVTGDTIAVACVDQGDTGERTAQDTQAQHRRREVVKLPEAQKGFVLCSAGGWWSAGTPGQRACAAWHAMMNGWSNPSPVCIVW